MNKSDTDLLKEYKELLSLSGHRNLESFAMPNSGEPFDYSFEKRWKDGDSEEFKRIVEKLYSVLDNK